MTFFEVFGANTWKAEAELLQVGIFFLIHLFAWEILLLKKLEIEETKTTQYSTFKTDTYNKSGLSFFDFQLFLY